MRRIRILPLASLPVQTLTGEVHMDVQLIQKDDLYYLNFCAKHLARSNPEGRHIYGGIAAQDPIHRIAEAWRFPIVNGHLENGADSASRRFDEVSFIYHQPNQAPPASVAVIGTFGKLFEPIPLKPVGDTPYFALTAVIPRGEVHRYRYLVDGDTVLDPVNPQRATLDNGEAWSRFFTRDCTQPLVLEHWEHRLLDRLTDHILPFRTEAAENFLARHFQQLDEDNKQVQYRHDQGVGVVNYVDKLLAREESHHLIDYQICLELVEQVLRQRNPVDEPWHASRELFAELYGQMGSGSVPGWDYGRYSSPRYFLQLLRRHTFTGAFAHPDYGGNAGAAAWAFLSERYRDPETDLTLFDWRRALPPPLGTNPAYRG